MNIPDYKGAGVYKIDFGFACYVGSSYNVRARIQAHKGAASIGKEPKRLQFAFDINPAPHVDILEEVPDNETSGYLRQRERHWVEEIEPKLNNRNVLGADSDGKIQQSMERIKGYENQIKQYRGLIEKENEFIRFEKDTYSRSIGELRKGGRI